MQKNHGMNSLDGLENYCSQHHNYNDGDRFGRMFPKLSPLFTDPRVLENLGRVDGPMDQKNANATADTIEVGQVFFGQFVDHDITLDVTSSFDRVNIPGNIANARTPTLDLDCIYGSGPEASPYLYYTTGDFRGVKLITGVETQDHPHASDDLARVNGVALIGDPRNDENRIVSQIQLAMIRFHNRVCDDLHGKYEGKELFEEAQKTVRWHYQWCVVHDFLKKICGVGVVDRILSQGRQWYKAHVPFIPVEFSVAAYRFGHAMVPMKVQAQKSKPAQNLFSDAFGRGFSPVPSPKAVVDMHEIFETFEDRSVQRVGRMDHKLSSQLLNLPMNIVGDEHGTPTASLATRNMIRGQSFLLPSGESVAAEMGRPQSEIDSISEASQLDEPGLQNGTPLWYYILREADIVGREDQNGQHTPGEGLGPVGATIVAETILGLIELDPRAWLGSNRNWRPSTYANDPAVEISTVGNMVAYT